MKEFLASLKWTVGLVWRHHRKLFLYSAAIILVRGLLPAGLALTARGLINSATSLVQDAATDPKELYGWLLLGFFVALAEALSLHLNTLVMRRLRDQVNSRLTVDILDQASRRPLSFFEDSRQRELIERAKSGASGRVSSFLQSSLASVTHTFQAVSLVAVLTYVEPLVLVIVGPIALPFLLHQWRLSRERYRVEMDRTTQRRRTGYFSGLLTSARSVAEVKLLGIARHLVTSYEEFIMTFKEQDWRLAKSNFRGYAAFSTATAIAFYLVLARVALKAARGASTLGDLAIFGGAAVRIRFTLEKAITQTTSAMEQLLFISEVRKFLEPLPGDTAKAVAITSPLRGEVEFRDVCFTYPGCESSVLTNFSLHVRPGEKLAVVGRNGAGKTTFVKLLAGLYPPDKGVILLDGMDSRSLAPESIGEILSVVMQHYGRYDAPAWENIAYGNWGKLHSRPDLVKKIAEHAQVSELIESLPAGFDTVLGRSFGEYDLSEGQWQKMAIARGFARECPVLVLDEPTASLDARSEIGLYDQFSRLAKDRTTILISHRFSTIGMADRIVVIDGGRVVETGSHDELMARRGHYADLYHLHYKWIKEGRAFD